MKRWRFCFTKTNLISQL